MSMILKKVALAVMAAGVFWGYLALGTAPGAIAGQPIPDSVATDIRGGICQTLNYGYCPGGPWYAFWCPAGTNVVAGPYWGTASGNIDCNPSCGSFFNTIDYCPGS